MTRTKINLVATLMLLSLPPGAAADRERVLKQIDVPHDYYFREMYLPQQTSGPSALAWSPDGQELVYSMQGSLWRQRLDSGTAVQLTAGPGYDYQPDWSPDGTQIIFVRHDDDAMELQLLDLASGTVTPLTNAGAVNVEPRFSPDGSRLAFVSTQGTGRFHVWTGDFVEGQLDAAPLFQERQSEVPRYYYSSFDHELSPVFTPDGKSILYIGNAEIPYGTGAIWLRSLDSDAPARLVRKEETSWKARPDIAPDGRRIAYSSYLGRQWHQLWITGIEGIAEPFPLTYGEHDITAARWSPDGKRVAYVTNETGGLEIRIQEIVGGKVVRLPVTDRRYAKPMATLSLQVTDARDQPVSARVSVIAADGRAYAPDNSWTHADDGFDRSVAAAETRYFHTNGVDDITLPPGPTHVTIWRGLEHDIERRLINLSLEQQNSLTVQPAALDMPRQWRGWTSGDVHVHMNYGGAYRNTPARLVQQAEAEDLDVVFNLIVNKEQRVPDIAYFSAEPDRASTRGLTLSHAQEFHTSFWGHLGLLGLNSHLLMPDYSAYPLTGAASLFPDNATILRLARAQGAVSGYVHPFLEKPDPGAAAPITNALPVDAALGLVDYYEVVGFADHKASAEVWYGLLNCGIDIAAAGGTDAMANYASLRGPVGVNRTYVRAGDGLRGLKQGQVAWLAALKNRQTMATNGPLLGLEVDGVLPGGTVDLDSAGSSVSFRGFMRSAAPIDHLELVMNGEVIERFELEGNQRSADIAGEVMIDESSWLLLRAWNATAHPLIFDLYPYATTSAVRVIVDNQPQQSPDDADYFVQWIEKIREAVAANEDFNDESERAAIFANLDQALRRFDACR